MTLLLLTVVCGKDENVWPVVQAFVPTQLLFRDPVVSPSVVAAKYSRTGAFIFDNDYEGRLARWPKTTSLKMAQSFAITSCIEALDTSFAEDRQAIPISWWDPVHESAEPMTDAVLQTHTIMEEIPLYPLPAVYLPTGDAINYTLNNVEPRNIQMALDLQKKIAASQQEQVPVSPKKYINNNRSGPYFCVALRAIDTGRLARVGTLMRVIDMQVMEDTAPVLKSSATKDSSATQLTTNATGDESDRASLESKHAAADRHPFPRKIVVTCVAESTVLIQSVINPQSLTLEHRLRNPREYAKAKVVFPSQNNIDDSERMPQQRQQELQEQAAHAYQRVRQQYIVGAFDDLPLFENWTQALPPLTADDFQNDGWSTGPLLWQSLCHTIREGHQRLLAAERNEMLVAAAVRRGGILQLPVQLEDILPEDQQAVRSLEQSIQMEWTQLKLDPILDFQRILELDYALKEPGGSIGEEERLQYLVTLMAREQRRLEAPSARQSRLQQQRHERQVATAKEEPELPRKGAWFDDGVW